MPAAIAESYIRIGRHRRKPLDNCARFTPFEQRRITRFVQQNRMHDIRGWIRFIGIDDKNDGF